MIIITKLYKSKLLSLIKGTTTIHYSVEHDMHQLVMCLPCFLKHTVADVPRYAENKNIITVKLS